MSRGGKGRVRGPRLVNGEKRSETIRSSVTYSLLQQTDANAARLGVPRARYVEMGIEALNRFVEAGTVPTGPMEHWQQIAAGARSALLDFQANLTQQIAALGQIVIVGEREISAAELEAEREAQERSAA